MNHLTDDTKAILLLCGYFSKDSLAKPLGTVEYNKLVRWLICDDVKLRPGDLLQEDHLDRAEREAGFEGGRLKALLRRGVQLGFAVEEWDSAGIWVLSRSDDDYPRRYKDHLKEKAPPLLFGIGNRSLLQGGGLAIVGSRNVDGAGESFTADVAEACACDRMTVVSGGARGVDQTSMASALQAGGTVIGVLADSILKMSLRRDIRRALADDHLLLLSPYHPKAPFSVGNAMGRNKLIYAMADYGLVVSSDFNKGGTWAGATEELKRSNGIPVFVRMDGAVPVGNQKLIEQGGRRWPGLSDATRLKELLAETSRAPVAPSPTVQGQGPADENLQQGPKSPGAVQQELFQTVSEAPASHSFEPSAANLKWTTSKKADKPKRKKRSSKVTAKTVVPSARSLVQVIGDSLKASEGTRSLAALQGSMGDRVTGPDPLVMAFLKGVLQGMVSLPSGKEEARRFGVNDDGTIREVLEPATTAKGPGASMSLEELRSMEAPVFLETVIAFCLRCGFEPDCADLSADGKADLHGWLVTDLAKVPLAIRCKLQKGKTSVSAASIESFRKSLRPFESGLYLTTGSFAAAAAEEAQATGKPPVSLLDGDALAGLLGKRSL